MKSMLKVLFPLLLLALASQSLASPLLNLNLALDRTVLPSGQSEKAIIKVLLEVPQISDSSLRPPINLTLILDRSGSMLALFGAKDAHRMTRLDAVKNAVRDFVVGTEGLAGRPDPRTDTNLELRRYGDELDANLPFDRPRG